MKIRRLFHFAVPTAVAVGMIGMAMPVQAATKPAVVVNGNCSKGSLSNLQVQREDNGTLSIDFGVDMTTHTAGETWVYRMVDNRSVIATGTTATLADGSFSVTKVTSPKTGRNHIVVTARNSATGEVCRIRAIA